MAEILLLSNSTSGSGAAADRQAAAWGHRISHGAQSIANLGHPCCSDPREWWRSAFPHLAVFLSRMRTVPVQFKSAQKILSAEDAKQGPRLSGREFTFPKFAIGGNAAGTHVLQPRSPPAQWGMKGGPMAGGNRPHPRKSRAAPAACAIRVICARGCSLPCQLLGSVLRNASGQWVQRPDLTDDKYGTSGAKPAAHPASRRAADPATWRVELPEELTAHRRAVRNTAGSRARGRWKAENPDPLFPWGSAVPQRAGGGANPSTQPPAAAEAVPEQRSRASSGSSPAPASTQPAL